MSFSYRDGHWAHGLLTFTSCKQLSSLPAYKGEKIHCWVKSWEYKQVCWRWGWLPYWTGYYLNAEPEKANFVYHPQYFNICILINVNCLREDREWAIKWCQSLVDSDPGHKRAWPSPQTIVAGCKTSHCRVCLTLAVEHVQPAVLQLQAVAWLVTKGRR